MVATGETKSDINWCELSTVEIFLEHPTAVTGVLAPLSSNMGSGERDEVSEDMWMSAP